MNRSMLVGTLLVVAAFNCAAQMPPQNATARFNAFDKDGNGSISEDEYEDGIEQIFRNLDTDRNNRVSNDEVTKARPEQQDGMMSAADLIRLIDMNTDGELTEEELVRGSERRFQNLDTNHDEMLDLPEMKSGGGY